MAEPTKKALEKAKNAGASLPYVQWPKGATRRQRTPGVHHNPFDMRDPDQQAEGRAWLEGLREVLAAPTQDPAEIVGDIDDALKGAKA